MNYDNSTVEPKTFYTDEESKERIIALLEKSNEHEAEVLRLRFGLVDGKIRTLDEVSQELGITRERVRQIESKVLRRKYSLTRTKKIADFYK